MITNKKFALSFRIISLLIAISGILVTVIIPGTGFVSSSFQYYTVQSNILAVVLFALLTYKTFRSLKNDNESVSIFPRFEMICVIDLLLTLIIYWVLLAPASFTMGTGAALFSYRNMSVHLFTPLLCLIDYVLFAKSGHLKYSDVYAVLIFPLFYLAFSSIMGLSGYVFRIHGVDGLPVHYPYFFFDYDRVGWLAAIYILVLLAFFLLLSHLFYLFDKKVTKKIMLR